MNLANKYKNSPEICKNYVNSIKNRLIMYGFDENKIYIHEYFYLLLDKTIK